MAKILKQLIFTKMMCNKSMNYHLREIFKIVAKLKEREIDNVDDMFTLY